jgi:histidinol-phosphate/aromatic aminotransferase/cobyric acid decarboxylase-like protein
MDIDSVRSKHGGYWRYPHLDFHYLFNQYFPPPELYAELQDALLTLANSYPSSQHVLAGLLAHWKDERYFTPENLVVGNGSSELIKLLIDRVITKATVPLPTFNEFTIGPPSGLHRYALEEGDAFVLDVDRLLYEVRESGSDYAMIVNPNNPVGNLVDLTDVRRILDRGVHLVIDEAFMAFTEPRHSAEPLIDQYDNLTIVTSATKSVGIAGLRLGYALSANEPVKQRLRESLPIWNVNSLAEYVLEAFPRYREAHRASLERIKSDTQWFYDALHDVAYLERFPTCTNAVFCRVRGSARRLAEILFERHGFVVKDGIQQAELRTSASYVRMGVRNREDNARLLAALHAIETHEIQGPTTAAGAGARR